MTVLAVIFVIIICFLSTIIIFSYNKKNDVILLKYTMLDKGKMNINVVNASTVGAIRSYSEKNDGQDKYITFYTTFPLLSRYGKNEFEIEIDEECKNIYFNRGNINLGNITKKYKGELYGLVLRKNDTLNSWEIVK